MENIVGQKIANLLVLNQTEVKGVKRAYFTCQCDCGNIVNISRSRLLPTKIQAKSCGCLKRGRKPA